MDDIWNKNERIMELVGKHYNVELRAANAYFHLATNAKKLGYDNVAAFLMKMGHDKQEAHLTRLIKYLMKLDQILKINSISIGESHDCKTIQEVLNIAVKAESQVRESANQIAEIALSAKDFETFERMQWFVKDSIDDLEEISDLATYASAPNVNMINIEIIAAAKTEKEKDKEY